LIAGTGIASAALNLTAPDSVVRWINDDNNLAPGLPFTLASEPGSFKVYITEDRLPLEGRTYEIGVINNPQTQTGEPCNRPPLIDMRSRGVVFDTRGNEITGNKVALRYGDTFRSFVPHAGVYPSAHLSPDDTPPIIPYDGRHYYAAVTVEWNNPNGGWECLGPENTNCVFPVEFSTRDFWPDGSRPNEFSPPTVEAGTYTIYVQNRENPRDNDWAEVEIRQGEVSIQLLDTTRNPLNLADIHAGQTILITGRNTDSPFTFIWLQGPSLPPCGVGIPVRNPPPHVLQNGLSEPDHPLVIEGDLAGFFDVVEWNSGDVPAQVGSYKVVVSSQTAGLRTGQTRWACNIPCTEPDVCGLENCPTCEARGDLDITFTEPRLVVDPIGDIERCCCDGYPCGIVGGHSPIPLVGNTGGGRDLKVWLFGEGMAGPFNYFYTPSDDAGRDIRADTNGAFMFNANRDLIGLHTPIGLCALEPGEYTAVVQVPGFNGVFDVISDVDSVHWRGPFSRGTYNPDPARQYIISSQPFTWTRNAQIGGPGAIIGTPAVNALKAALEASLIDDRYVVVPFRLVDVVASGVVDFSATPLAGNSPLTVEFTDQTGFLVESWSWNFGDGQSSTEQHPVHVYERPGTYSVTLTATGSDGPKSLTKTSYINVIAPPTTDLNIRPELAFVGELVQFTDQSSPKPLTYLWDFGDGTTSPLESPVHAYAEQGIYTVTLTTSNQYGIGEPRIGYVTVANIPDVDFEASPRQTAGYPATVSFKDLSTEDPIRWSWEFTEPSTGVSLSSSEQNPVMIFNQPGSYTVKLTVWNIGRSNSEERAGYITIGNERGDVSFTANPMSGLEPLIVKFTDTSTIKLRTLEWDFGDGTTLEWECLTEVCPIDPNNDKRNPWHTYQNPGVYNVILTADGIYKSEPVTITVGDAPAADFRMNLPDGTPVNDGDRVGPADVTIHFTDLSTSSTGRITSWEWSFGDGGISSLQNPMFTYQNPGQKTISLSVSNEYGASQTVTKTIWVVHDGPVADFVAIPPSSTKTPVLVSFNPDASTGMIDTYDWTFELEGQLIGTSVERYPAVVFDNPFVDRIATYDITLVVSNDGGSSAPVTKPVTVGTERAGVSFTADPMRGLAPQEVQFTDTSDPEFKKLTWDFGDGSAPVEWECTTEVCPIDPNNDKRNPKHTYQNAGTFTVTLTGYNGLITDSYSLVITIGAAPDVTFRMTRLDGSPVRPDVDKVLIRETIRFIIDEKDTAWGPSTSWSWNFGDGGTSALQSPEYSYKEAGLWPVSLTVSNAYGQSLVIPPQNVWVVHDLPVASFFATPSSSPKNPVRVSFTDTSTGDIETWNWTFELEGQLIGNSAEQNPVMIFDKPGVYTITLVVSNDGGSSAPATGTVTVGNERARVFFDADPLWGLAPLTVQFTDRSDPDLKPKTLTWNFGDGETLVWECMEGCALDPSDPVRNPKHIYQNAGNYIVTLTADDGLAIYVSDPVTITVGGAPVAAFRMDKTVVQTGEEVLFTDLSTGDPTSWSWNFGDGRGTSALQSPMYSYSTPGEYTISLSVSNIYGESKVPATATILVTDDAPVASFYATPSDSPKNPVRVFFTDTSVGHIETWNWTFELGGQVIGNSAQQNPVMIFDKPGVYTIRLVVSNNGGSSAPATGTVTVGNERATVFFEADPLWGPEPLTVQFTDMSDPELKPKTLIWNFGDGSDNVVWECTDSCAIDPTDPLRNPRHTYQNAGSYIVTLTADDGLAIYVSDPVTITVGSAPRADFRMSKNVASIGENVLFTDISTGDPDSWQWDFGDGSWSSLRSPVHSYSQAGTYDITLTVGNRYTSSLSVTKSILITENPPTDADVDFVCNPLVNPFLPASIQCTDLSNKDVVITSWYWEFIRDGVLVWCSSEQNPIATINEPGIYDVRLTIGNNGGEASLTKERYVVVGEGNSVIVYPGWNHVAVPVELANGFNTMADVFTGIQTGAWPYSIYSWERQDWFEVADDYIVRPLELVRVNSAEPGPVESTFVFATREGTYQTLLQEGWNGIGISAWQPIIANVALASLGDKWDRVIGYDASLQVWEEPIYRTINADVRYMHPGMGYIILMDEEAIFTNGVKL